MAARQGRRQRQLVDKPAPRTIDDSHPGLGLVQRIRRQDVAGLLGQRGVKCDHIRDGKKIIKLDFLDTDLAGMFRCQKRIKPDHLHLQPLGAVGHDRPNISAADNTKRLAGDLGPHKARLFPFAGLR